MAKKTYVAGAAADFGDAAANVMQNLKQSALSSMEQFITGLKIVKGHPHAAETPGFRAPSNKGDENGTFGEGLAGPTLDELDPYFPINVMDGDTDGTQFFVGCDYRGVLHSEVSRTGGDINLNTFKDAKPPGKREDIKWVKPTNALRGPIIVSGWGFGMDDFPVPQKGPEWPANGQFDQGMVHNRALWKTGPVHLMWDDERQVWQGGYPIVCGVVAGAITAPVDVCTPTEFTVNLFRNTQHIPDPANSGDFLKLSDVTGETITVQNRDPSLEQDEVENAIFCMAIKLNYEWLPLWVGCPETPACGEIALAGEQPKVPECITNSTC